MTVPCSSSTQQSKAGEVDTKRASVCSFPGCTTRPCVPESSFFWPLASGELCSLHSKRFCQHEGCTNKAVREGLCTKHHPRVMCSVAGCNNKALIKSASQLCRKHSRPEVISTLASLMFVRTHSARWKVATSCHKVVPIVTYISRRRNVQFLLAPTMSFEVPKDVWLL